MNDKQSQGMRMRVLIVENRVETRETLQNSLMLWGYETVLAEGSGVELLRDAEDKARSYRCHFAVVDKRLTDDGDFADFSGLSLIEKITPTIVIILTGYADYVTARDALKMGAFDVIRKEDGPKPLRDALTRASIEKWRRREVPIERSPVLESMALVRRLFPNDETVPVDEVDDILRQLFPNAKQLRLELPSGDDSPSNLLLRMRSVVVKVYEDDAGRPCIVKIARAKRTKEEIERFNRARPYFTAGRYAHVQGEPVQLWDLGGVAYEFIGEDNYYPIETFADYYTTHKTSDIILAIDNFMAMWGPLYQRRPPQKEPQQKSLIVAYTAVWGSEWLQDLMRYQELPPEIERPTVFRELGLQNPIQWLIDKVKLTNSGSLDASATPHTELVMCHGDLHSRNMFVDTRHDVWVIDYERTGFGPRLQDLAELTIDILTTLLNDSSNELRLVEFLLVILNPKTLDTEILKDEAPDEFHKEVDLFSHFSALARQNGGSQDAKPFYWGLFLNAVFRLTLFLKDWDRIEKEQSDESADTKSSDLTKLKNLLFWRIQNCLLLAGVLCHRLHNWRNTWPPPNWPIMSDIRQSVDTLGTKGFSSGYALLIGVSETPYAPGVVPLPVTFRDIEAVYRILTNPNRCAYPSQYVQLLHGEQATYEGITDGFKRLASNVSKDPNATAIIYFSGHGIRQVDSGRFGLIPHNFSRDSDGRLKPDTVLWSDKFVDLVNSVHPKRLLVMVDSCHSEGMIGKDGEESTLSGYEKSPPPSAVLDSLASGRGRVFISSCEENQQSYAFPSGLSFFTHHLIEALEGRNNQVGDTEVRFSNLINHLGKAVNKTAATFGHKQDPIHSSTRSTDFPVALLFGGKGL